MIYNSYKHVIEIDLITNVMKNTLQKFGMIIIILNSVKISSKFKIIVHSLVQKSAGLIAGSEVSQVSSRLDSSISADVEVAGEDAFISFVSPPDLISSEHTGLVALRLGL